MSEDYAFAKNLVNDYVELGYAEKETDTSLRSLDGETVVEFEVELTPSENSRREDRTLHIFSDGVEIFSEVYEYGDRRPVNTDEILKRIVEILASELNF